MEEKNEQMADDEFQFHSEMAQNPMKMVDDLKAFLETVNQ